MRHLLVSAMTLLVMLASTRALADTSHQESIQLQDLFIETPAGWKLHQSANADGTLILGFASGADYVTFYAKSGSEYDMKAIYAAQGTVLREEDESHGPLKWKMMESRRNASAGKKEMYVASFGATRKGYTYSGYSHSTNRAKALSNVTLFLKNTMVWLSGGQRVSRSLTGHDFTGQKYYFGWGAAGMGDPSMMHNEVKYDVLHTHDIFTEKVGGEYQGSKLIGASDVSSGKIRNEWTRLQGLMNADDMYVQYSSGHGSPSGLGVGVSYKEMRDAVLKMKGKELIVFTMACHSGGLVNSFDQVKSQWQAFADAGRTLFVMTSSPASELSSTGPGTDPDQAGGPNGSAGSAFGHALWKALIGYADGEVDGVTDGFLSLEEIRDFSVRKTKEVGGHQPVHTGSYNGNLIMNQAPSKAWLARLEGSSEGMSDAEIQKRIEALDREFRVH